MSRAPAGSTCVADGSTSESAAPSRVRLWRSGGDAHRLAESLRLCDSGPIPESLSYSSLPSPRRAIVAATVGNALEFYDFVTYAFFAIQIGRAFFPAGTAYGSLMLSLATFGVGFVTRPIGAVVIGSYADRAGRRAAMTLSFTMMGAATVAMAVIPPYAKIGVAAPVLAVVARMVMGFSLGGEVGPTTAYLLESAPVARRGLTVAWQGGSQYLSAAAGGGVGFALSILLRPAAIDAYGWRFAFALGVVTLPFGLWVRRGLPETLHTTRGGVPRPYRGHRPGWRPSATTGRSSC